ncbi:MAG: hypothetical protein AAF901_11750, partial [Bacteroidota bacterium]
HDEFDHDNDYQSLQKIITGLKQHNYTEDDIDLLLADIKVFFFSDGDFDTTEQNMLLFLSRIFK